jgi:ABC-type lipoprotein release transport system permease subunit
MISFERWRALRHHRLQATLAIAAMATAVALPVILLSVGGGVAAHEIASIENSGFQVTVSAGGLHGIADAHHLSQQIDSIPGVTQASPVLSAPLDAFPPSSSGTPLLAEGIVPVAFTATESPQFRGLFPDPLPFSDPTDSVHFGNGTYSGPSSEEVMVSTPFASDYGLSVGETLRLSETDNLSQAVAFRIVGLFGTPPEFLSPTAVYGVLLPLSDLQVLVGVANTPADSGTPIDAADTIEVALIPSESTDPTAVQRVASEISALVPYYGVSALTDEASQLRASAAVLTGFYLALSSVGLLVGLVFLTLVLLRRVESERRTIGVQRAIGVPASQVALEWLGKSVTLGAAGALGGFIAGAACIWVLARYGQGGAATAAQLAVFDPATLLPLAAAIIGLAALAGLVATRAALRIPITEALR